MAFYPNFFNNNSQFDSSNSQSSPEKVLSQQSTTTMTTTSELCNETMISMGSQETIVDHHNHIDNSLESLSQFNTPLQKNKGYLSDSLLNTEKIVHETPEIEKNNFINKAFNETSMDEEKNF
jgi:hypothetical protein